MPQFTISKQCIQNNIVIITDKSMLKHISSVLRLKENDELLLIDEDEVAYISHITYVAKDKLIAQITHAEQSNKKLNFRLDLLQCTLKTTAMEVVVQKMTELGVKNFYCMPSKRSVPKYNEKDIISKINKWFKITDESCKQCERADKPTIMFIPNFNTLKEHAKNYDLVIACVERSSEKTLKDVLRKAPKHDSVLLIIGPEGGFEDSEIEFFKENNFEMVSISNLIYRAETAAISALAGVVYEYEL